MAQISRGLSIAAIASTVVVLVAAIGSGLGEFDLVDCLAWYLVFLDVIIIITLVCLFRCVANTDCILVCFRNFQILFVIITFLFLVCIFGSNWPI